uniref:Uncharacterized protein n=1 Tax=Rhizophora mucronata TaxID=61149 RepID=A0A2P2PXG2_RHIMU
MKQQRLIETDTIKMTFFFT